MKMTTAQWIRLVLGGLTFVAAVWFLTSFPKAHADTADDQFMNAVSALGISGDRAALIADGHAACDNYGQPGLLGQSFNLLGRGMDRTQAAGLLIAGWKAYCPEKIAGSGI
jgi:hypothetical protein